MNITVAVVLALASIAAAAVALVLVLSPTAYTGGLGAPLATRILANPLAASAIGLTLLGERIHGGLLGTALAPTGAALANRGILLLARPTTTFPAADGARADVTHGPVRTAPAPRPPVFGRPTYPRLAGATQLEGRTL